MSKCKSSNIDKSLNDDYIERMGNFFERNRLHERYDWSFDWFLKRCAEGKAPEIPNFNWGSAS